MVGAIFCAVGIELLTDAGVGTMGFVIVVAVELLFVVFGVIL